MWNLLYHLFVTLFVNTNELHRIEELKYEHLPNPPD